MPVAFCDLKLLWQLVHIKPMRSLLDRSASSSKAALKLKTVQGLCAHPIAKVNSERPELPLSIKPMYTTSFMITWYFDDWLWKCVCRAPVFHRIHVTLWCVSCSIYLTPSTYVSSPHCLPFGQPFGSCLQLSKPTRFNGSACLGELRWSSCNKSIEKSIHKLEFRALVADA